MCSQVSSRCKDAYGFNAHIRVNEYKPYPAIDTGRKDGAERMNTFIFLTPLKACPRFLHGKLAETAVNFSHFRDLSVNENSAYVMFKPELTSCLVVHADLLCHCIHARSSSRQAHKELISLSSDWGESSRSTLFHFPRNINNCNAVLYAIVINIELAMFLLAGEATSGFAFA